MTLESAFPYLSVIAAVAGAVVEAPWPRKAFRVAALAALALFAYFRSIAPAEVPAALMLGAWAAGFERPAARRWRSLGAGLTAIGWLVFAYLFLRVGEGRSAFLTDAVKAALLVALIFGTAFGIARLWPAAGRARWGLAGEAVALTAMAAAGLTLYWSFWPAMAGAGSVLASEALLAVTILRPTGTGEGRQRPAWALNYLGQAAMAFAFLR